MDKHQVFAFYFCALCIHDRTKKINVSICLHNELQRSLKYNIYDYFFRSLFMSTNPIGNDIPLICDTFTLFPQHTVSVTDLCL